MPTHRRPLIYTSICGLFAKSEERAHGSQIRNRAARPHNRQEGRADARKAHGRYENLAKPGPVKKIGTKVAKSLPEPVRKAGARAKDALTEQELYEAALKVIGTGFGAVQEQAAKFSISADKVVERVNATSESEITTLDEVCLARGYDVAALVERSRAGNLAAAFVEGAATGAPGFAGIPFNLVLSTFLYFRAVQAVAMTYGYDVKRDAAEMEIAGQVFANSMDPASNKGGNGAASIIGKS